MDLLKRELAPVLPEAWTEIDGEASRVLNLNLAGRKLVDFDGPHGWKAAAVNTGRLELLEEEPEPGVRAAIREVQPLVELRIPLVLQTMEIDSIARGARSVDLEPVINAAEAIARAEDKAIFGGYPRANITGIIQASPHAPLPLPTEPTELIRAFVAAREQLREAGINGPYALALSAEYYKLVSQASEDGYPLRKRIDQQVIDGPLVRASAIEGAVLLSIRGGDFELTVGQDLSVGYAYHDKHTVELYITESFTFRILEPAAAIYLTPAGTGAA
ncbi:MAG TPA: family 1 encapsulin nanocompartment shell protein [Terriglobales bacterium]|nr:family 1 encapsulin nanocompartment shell protein [Terriglobales bacterium]